MTSPADPFVAFDRVTKAPEAGGDEGAAVGEGMSSAVEALEHLGEGGGHASHGSHGGGGEHGGGHGHAASHGGHAGAAHEHGGGGHAEGGGGHPLAPTTGEKEKPAAHAGGGGGRARDEHGRFVSSKSFMGDWGAPLPSFDRLQDEEGDFEIGLAAKAYPPIAHGPLGTGDDYDEMVEDWSEIGGDYGADPDPDNAVDGGDDENSPPPGDDDEDGAADFSPFDDPVHTEMRAVVATKDASGPAEENAGGDMDDTPWGEPDPFQDAGAFYNDDDDFSEVIARAKVAALPIETSYQGIPISIDRPRGFVQEGGGPDGAAWRRVYLTDYGFIPGTEGGDDEDLDVFLGPCADAETAYWVRQNDFAGAFDEWKLFLGFASPAHAMLCFRLHIPEELFGGMSACPVAQIRALLGCGADEVIKRCTAAPSAAAEAIMGATTTKPTVRKDAMPAGPGGQPNGDEEPEEMDNGGADVIAIASEQLDGVCDSLDAEGGVVTPEIKAQVANIITLLQVVAPDGDDEDDLDDEDPGVAPMGPSDSGAGEIAARAEKRRVGKIMWRTRKTKMTAAQFVAYAVGQLHKAKKTKSLPRRAKRLEMLGKALTYGTEAFGETAFQNPNSDVAEIPAYEEAFVTQNVDANVATPALEEPKSGFAFDATYEPNANSQVAFDAGSPQSMEKRLAALAKGVGALLAHAGVRKNEASKAAWTQAYMNELPDDSFLYVEAGGSKDAGGLTVPRDLRHFPYKDKDGNVDLPHLRDALARIPDSGLPDDKKKEVTAHAQEILAHASDAEKSDVQKALRKDDGWPIDLNTPEFMKGERALPVIPFGFDDLPTKVAKMDEAEKAAASDETAAAE